MARVTMLSAGEAWLEGLRVDPGVRRRSVASSLHVASLAWARAQGATVVRYATGKGNAGSHRIGERHGFAMLGAWRTFAPPASRDPELAYAADPIAFAGVGGEGPASPDADDPSQSSGGFAAAGWAAGLDDSEEPDGAHDRERFAPDFPGVEDDRTGTRARATSATAGAAGRVALRDAGLLLPAGGREPDIDRWWAAIASDATFMRAGGLYEARPWRFQALTRERLGDHVRLGDVLASGDPDGPWGVVILGTDEYWRPGEHHESALAAGDGGAVLAIATAAERALSGPLNLRLPGSSPPLVAGHEGAFAAAGFRWDDDALHVLGRSFQPDAPLVPPGLAGTLVFGEEPHRVAVPRPIGG
jgi:hypothetical protein